MNIKYTLLILFSLSVSIVLGQDSQVYKGKAINQVKVSFDEMEAFDKTVPKDLLRHDIKDEFK